MKHRVFSIAISFLLAIVTTLSNSFVARGADSADPADAKPAEAKATDIKKDIVYAKVDNTDLKLDMMTPPRGDGPFPLIIWIHGGVFQISVRQHNYASMAGLANMGYVSVTIQCRMPPKVRFPSQLDDLRAAVKFLRDNCKAYKIDPNRIGVVGGSASGQLALLLGMAKKDHQPTGISAVVAFFSPTDFRTYTVPAEGDAFFRQRFNKDLNGLMEDYLGTSDRGAKIMTEASPLTYVESGGPAVLTVHGSDDQIVPVAQAKLLHDALKKAGVPEKLVVVDGGEHAFSHWPDDQKRMANKLLVQFFDQYLKGKTAETVTESPDVVHHRIVDKVERVKAAVQKWKADGRDPSDILKTMHEKVGPLFDSGNFTEGEAELDRVLDRLEHADKGADPAGAAPSGAAPRTNPASTQSTSAKPTSAEPAWAVPNHADENETRYLNFQLMTGLPGYSGPRPLPGHFAPSKPQLQDFVQDVVKTIGTTGTAKNKLGFTVGPLCFDMSDDETRQFIHDAFSVARGNDVAVAFHIDDSMGWAHRKDLMSNPDNIETSDWTQTPNTGRRMDWGPKPTKFAPQMCFNSAQVKAAVKERAALIATEVKKETDDLKASGKGYLFAGVIAGWETRIGRDFDTDRALGYRALSHRGYSESNPPSDADAERVQIVKEFIELWANSLCAAGIPREKVFCHIAFTPQGLDGKEKAGSTSTFSPPDVAFSAAYRPGFSTYPEASTFRQIYASLASHGSRGWISAEGVNVSPTGMPGEPTMETYLGRMFNHGAVMTNIYSWGMGGPAMRNNFFRRATENPEALAAYGKFLRSEPLVESTGGFSAEKFQGKMHRIQSQLPDWVQTSDRKAQVMPMIKNLQSLVKAHKFLEADKAADEVLSLISGDEKR